MSKSGRVIAINLGSHSISVGFYSSTAGGLLLEGAVIETIALEGASEEEREKAVANVLRRVLTGKISQGTSIYYCISGQSVFTRFVKLPPSAPEQVTQMVRFEAQQNVPFPMDQVVWDYQLVQSVKNSDLEAVIVAIKAEMLDRINSGVSATGCVAERVGVGPLSLYNAFRFNYPDYEGCTLILDIGAKSTQLIFAEDGKIFIRGVPIGGNQITQAIATDMQLSFAEAEQLKQEKGFVGLGGAYADPDDATAARISKVIRGILTRLHSEVSRSIVSYRSQQGGSAPMRILLTGGSSLLAYMDLFFSEKLRVPIEFFNPLRNVAVAPSISRETLVRSAAWLGETVGLALHATGPCPLDINLVPASVEASRASGKRRSLQVALAAALVVLFGVLWASHWRKGNILQAQLATISGEVGTLESANRELKAVQTRYEKALSEAEQIDGLIKMRRYWPGLLKELNTMIPVGVWITALKPAFDDRELPMVVSPITAPPKRTTGKPQSAAADATQITHLLIEGSYENINPADLQTPDLRIDGQEVIGNFLKKFPQSQFFAMTEQDIADPKLVTVDVVSVEEKRLALNFKIKAKLKTPIPLVP
ncbi:MAG: pilus assembly protein PilM [Verrucomicrobiae bacterium]|nr:pilus assembly protein PilM [Verrucomicrobiae bacterium]